MTPCDVDQREIARLTVALSPFGPVIVRLRVQVPSAQEAPPDRVTVLPWGPERLTSPEQPDVAQVARAAGRTTLGVLRTTFVAGVTTAFCAAIKIACR